MPYYVDSPLATGLGFAGSYLQARNQRKKDQQDFEREQEAQRIDQANLAISQAQEARAAQEGALTLSGDTQQTQAKEQMRTWYKSHPPPDPSDTKAYGNYAAQAAWQANQLGLSDDAKESMSDYRTGQQAGEFGALSGYTSGAKTDLTNAQTGLTNAKTRFENEHARNEKNRFAHDMSMLDAKTQAQVMESKMRIGAMLAATGMRVNAGISENNARIAGQKSMNQARIGASEQNNQLTNETREAISMRAAILSQQYHSDQMGLQQALAEYRTAAQSYLQNEATSLQGKATEPGWSEGGSMPTFNVNMPSQPQQPQAPTTYNVYITTPDGRTVPVPIPVQPHPKVTVGNRNPAQFNPQQPPQQPLSPIQKLEQMLGSGGSWLLNHL